MSYREKLTEECRPEPAVTNLSPLPGITRTRTQGSDSRDQLPRYEAPPPEYDVIIKDLERGDASQLREDEERGEPSRVGPPEYNIPDRRGDGTVVAVNQVPAEASESVPVNLAGSGTPNREGSFRIDVRRAWSGLGR